MSSLFCSSALCGETESDDVLRDGSREVQDRSRAGSAAAAAQARLAVVSDLLLGDSLSDSCALGRLFIAAHQTHFVRQISFHCSARIVSRYYTYVCLVGCFASVHWFPVVDTEDLQRSDFVNMCVIYSCSVFCTRCLRSREYLE